MGVTLISKPVEDARRLRKEGNFAEALRLLESFLTTLKSNQRAEKLAIFNEQSQCLWRTGQYVEAEALAQQALALAQQVPADLFGQAEALSNLGNIYRAMGKLDQAEDFEQRSLSLREELGNPEDIAASLNNLGSIYWQKGELTRAEEAYQKSLSIRETIGKPHDIASTLNNLGLVYLWLGKLDHSEKFYKRALTLFEEAGNPQDIAKCLNNLGLLYQQQGKLDLAEKAFQRALTLGEELGNLQDVARYLNNLGLVYSQRGRLDQAEEYYLQSYTLKKKIGNPLDIANSLINLGEVCVQRGELDRATEYYRQILVLKEPLSNPGVIAMTLNNLGVIYWRQGRLDKAKEVLQQALIIREEIGNRLREASTLFHLISVVIDKHNFEEAKQFLERLGQINEQEDNKESNQRYRIAKALVLKTSSRARDKIKAGELLEEVVEEEIVHHGLTEEAMLHLCEILLDELKAYGEETVLQQAKSLMQKLYSVAQENRSFWLVVQVLILQAKLAIIGGGLTEAARFLDQARFTAEENALSLLTEKVLFEQRLLEEQYDKWQDLIQRNAPLQERFERARFVEYIKAAQRVISTGGI